ncbi:MAG: hypothetical protein M3O29_00225 [Actinomycetota bacterium]|nr:hypothetical protein [Actinomycetota bacterium]
MSDEDLYNNQDPANVDDTMTELPADVPEADAAEQSRPAAPSDETATEEVADRPEADALEQDRIEGEPPEEEHR